MSRAAVLRPRQVVARRVLSLGGSGVGLLLTSSIVGLIIVGLIIVGIIIVGLTTNIIKPGPSSSQASSLIILQGRVDGEL